MAAGFVREGVINYSTRKQPNPDVISYSTGARSGENGQQWQQASSDKATSATILEAARRNQTEREKQPAVEAS
eukprot:7348977-Pyramimonas_sp.AAC.1